MNPLPNTNRTTNLKQKELKDETDKRQKEFFKFMNNNSDSTKLASNFGFHENSMKVMQIADTMSHLRSLMAFSIVNNISSPLKSMELFMTLCNNQRSANNNGSNNSNNLPSNGPNSNGNLNSAGSGTSGPNGLTGNGANNTIVSTPSILMANGTTSSPSPHTLTNPDDSKTSAAKKRKMSNSNSLLGLDNNNGSKLQRRKQG